MAEFPHPARLLEGIGNVIVGKLDDWWVKARARVLARWNRD